MLMPHNSKYVAFFRKLSAHLIQLTTIVQRNSRMSRLEKWTEGWAAGRTTFHKSNIHEYLLQFKDQLLVKKPSRVLVPLCGKTLDMRWLMDEGHEVVGVEGVAQAIQEFFDEQKLPYKESDVEGLSGAKLYQTEDGKLKLYQCDFFDISKDNAGEFDAIWDRASLVAVEPSDRQRYADVLSSVLSSGGRILSEVFFYDPEERNPKGAPYSVSEEEFKQLFGEKFNIELLADDEFLANNPRFRDRGLTWMRRHMRLLTLK